MPTSGIFRRSIRLLGTNHILLKVLSIKRHLSLMISAFKVWTPTELMALYRRCTERIVHIKGKQNIMMMMKMIVIIIIIITIIIIIIITITKF